MKNFFSNLYITGMLFTVGITPHSFLVISEKHPTLLHLLATILQLCGWPIFLGAHFR
jgi:hypothetical protein